MSSLPQETDKQRRRRPKKVASDVHNGDDSAQTDEGVARPKPNQNKKKQHQESALTQQLEDNGAVTPPKAQGRNANRNVFDNDHTQNNGQKSVRKKKNNQQQTNDGHMNTPGPKNQNRHGNNTPSKPQIAMDAYAGPTFHASPAPSALPIPKMFSKSAPTVEKEVGITARLNREESAASSGSDGSPDSPSRRPNVARVVSQDSSFSGPALFDMLMNADRQEKARQLHGQTLSPPQPNTRENSTSPVHTQSLHRPSHSRTLTDSQMFPLEATNANSQSPSPAPGRQPHPHHLGSPFGASGQHQPSPDDKLKRMLFSSPPQSAPTPYHNPTTQWHSSPMSQGTSPYASPSSSNGLASSSRPAPVSPYTQASPSPSARRGYPHPNSNLRRELSPGGLNNTPPHLGNLPQYNAGNGGSPLTSPTQQRFGNRGSTFGGQNRNAPPAGNTRFSAQDALRSLGDCAQTSEMEDRLRQILRIDQMRPQNAQNPNRASAVPS